MLRLVRPRILLGSLLTDTVEVIGDDESSSAWRHTESTTLHVHFAMLQIWYC